MEKELMEIINNDNKVESISNKLLKEFNELCANGYYEDIVKAHIAFECGLTSINSRANEELNKAYEKYMKSTLSFEEIVDDLCVNNEVIQEEIC